jgi:hypothetical protein
LLISDFDSTLTQQDTVAELLRLGVQAVAKARAHCCKTSLSQALHSLVRCCSCWGMLPHPHPDTRCKMLLLPVSLTSL